MKRIRNLLHAYAACLTKNEKILRIVSTVAGELVVLCTLIVLLIRKDSAHLDMCITSFAMVLLPVAVELLLRCKMRLFIYISTFIYAFTPMCGECFRMYYTTIWWDKFSHIVGGMICAMYGFYIFRRLCGGKANRIAAALFALFFSVTFAVGWECFEYAGDCLFGMDTQNDVIIREINSYMIPTDTGVPGTIKEIKIVTLDGKEFPFEGYLDIGLHDSMQDMIVEIAGALVAMAIILIDKEKHLMILPFDTGGETAEKKEEIS